MSKRSYHFSLILIVLCFSLAAFVAAGCGGGDGSSPAPTQTASPAPTMAKWTFLVYLDADNSLSYYDYLDMKEMEKIGSTSEVNIVVQWDRMAPDSYVDWSGCRRYYVKKDTTEQQTAIQSDILEEMGTVDMGSPDTLVTFVNWGKSHYPAEKYAVILWDHGNGWKGIRNALHAGKSIAVDETANTSISEEELRQAFTRITTSGSNKIEFVGMDACLMATVEVTYDMKTYANYMACSEASEGAEGWPYTQILQILTATPDMTGEGLGSAVISGYSQYYQSADDATQVALNLSKMDALGQAIDNFSQAAILRMSAQRTALKTSGTNAKRVDNSYTDYRDLGNFLDLVQTNVTDDGIKAYAAAVDTALTNAIVAEYHTTMWNGCTGISIWIPNAYQYNYNISLYETLNFASGTHWNEYLKEVLEIES